MPSIMYESTNNFCQLLNKPGVIIAVAIWIHLVVMAYNSESIDEFLTLLLSPFSKKGFILSWVAIFLIVPMLLVIGLISRLCK